MELKSTTWSIDDAGVGLLTLDRPHRLNAWTDRMGDEYRWLLEEADRDPAVRVVVVTGAGRGFCAGADLKALDLLSDAGGYTGLASDRAVVAAVPKPHAALTPVAMAKPVIAAVNGPAAGVGFVVMCFADLRFAAADAKLTTSFARLGLPAEHGISWILPRLVGHARALDLLLSARVILGDEAEALGVVNRALPRDEVLPTTLTYARAMAQDCSPRSLAAIKAQVSADHDRRLDVSTAEALGLMATMTGEADFAEGVAAQAEKRQPRFPGLP